MVSLTEDLELVLCCDECTRDIAVIESASTLEVGARTLCPVCQALFSTTHSETTN